MFRVTTRPRKGLWGSIPTVNGSMDVRQLIPSTCSIFAITQRKGNDMTPIFKGILVVLIAIGLWAVACKAKAGTLDELATALDGVSKVYPQAADVGSCWFDENGAVTFKKDAMKTSRMCIVGMKLPDTTVHYLLLGDEDGATELIVFDEKDKSQKVLWKKGMDT